MVAIKLLFILFHFCTQGSSKCVTDSLPSPLVSLTGNSRVALSQILKVKRDETN